jgi:arylsulfatase
MPPQETPTRPNIILILCDDMGFSDIGCYGSEIETPNLDRLAAGGLAFRQMYNCARCCPTRASIMTGLYPHRAGVGQMVNDRGRPAYQGYLNDQCVTIAEAVKPAGYRTYMSGKWHCGGHYNVQQPESWTPGDATHPTPVQRGFDEHFGTLCGAGSYFFPPTLARNDRFIKPDNMDFHLTDATSDEAVRMIGDAADAGEPFFLYVAYTAPHWPLHSWDRYIEKYRGKYAGGWDAVRTARHETLKGAGIVDPKWPISPRDEDVPAWDDVESKDYQDALMATYAAMIDQMDDGIGRILAALDAHGVADSTLVLFLSDNGGCHEYIRHGSGWSDRLKRPTLDGKEVVVGDAPGVLPGGRYTYQSYNRPWANASNTPFRMFKHWVHEGGIATPLIAYWPGTIAPRTQTDALAHVIDVLPTCVDAAGAEYPEQRGDKPVKPADGESLLPLLRGEDWSRQKDLYWEHEGNRAVRQGRWKLVSRFEKGDWELYDMLEDRTELNDLSAVKDDKVRELSAAYDRWAACAEVEPWEQVRGG